MSQEGQRYVEVRKESLTLERIALAAVVALLSWNVYTTNSLTIQQAVAQAQLESIKQTLATTNSRYATSSQVLVLASEVESQETRFTNWINRLSERMNELEEKVDSSAQ